MKKIFFCLFLLHSLGIAAEPELAKEKSSCPSWLTQTLPKLHSSDQVDICKVSQGKVVLIVNTASQCGFTPQFKQLEQLYQRYKDQGFTIIGFPSDSFYQEHDDAQKTATVCYQNYGVSFPMVASSKVRGSKSNAVFKHLAQTKVAPKWNFYKYLINQQGKVVDYFVSTTEPMNGKIEQQIQQLLKHSADKP
ncbi:MAG: glutathione peroxidase [Pseudomonadales bacterium]|nr:glutathione peroxidase [Pseudomonadales bacterium]